MRIGVGAGDAALPSTASVKPCGPGLGAGSARGGGEAWASSACGGAPGGVRSPRKTVCTGNGISISNASKRRLISRCTVHRPAGVVFTCPLIVTAESPSWSTPYRLKSPRIWFWNSGSPRIAATIFPSTSLTRSVSSL